MSWWDLIRVGHFFFFFQGALDKYNIIPKLFPKKVGIFTPLEVLAWVMTACWVSCSILVYFLRNINISSIFYFSKLTSINTRYSSLWDTLEMMLFTKYLIKWTRIGRLSWKFRYRFNLKFSIEFDIIKRWMLYLSNAPLDLRGKKSDLFDLNLCFCLFVFFLFFFSFQPPSTPRSQPK